MSSEQRPDSEIRFGVFIWLGIALVGLVGVAMVLMWLLSARLFEFEQAQDPPPPVLLEAREPHEPPAPRLQADPFGDLESWRSSQKSRLGTYGPVEGSPTLALIPGDRAMDLLVERGLPELPVIEEATDEPAGEN
jgi:hypothetical protein